MINTMNLMQIGVFGRTNSIFIDNKKNKEFNKTRTNRHLKLKGKIIAKLIFLYIFAFVFHRNILSNQLNIKT